MEATVANLLAAIAADTPFRVEEDRKLARKLLQKIIRTARSCLVINQQRKLAESIIDSSTIHKGQYRKDGVTPYIIHLLEVACILIEVKVRDFKSLCAAILHDTIEDTKHTENKTAVQKLIQKKYGAMVSRIVELLSKKEGEAKEMQWRRLLSEPDLTILWRVLAIKYADRIHNARTFSALKKEDVERKVSETLLWFPVIERKLKNTLEKLWEKRTIKKHSMLNLHLLLKHRLDVALAPHLQ